MRPGSPSEAQSIQFQDALQVSEQHLYLLTITLRLLIGLRLSNRTRHITRWFVGTAVDFSDRRVGAALRLERANLTVV